MISEVLSQMTHEHQPADLEAVRYIIGGEGITCPFFARNLYQLALYATSIL